MFRRLSVSVGAVAIILALGMTATASAEDIIELVPGTAILADQSSGTGSGGTVKTVSSSTSIFAPATYVDYKRFGGEPTVTVDRFPFLPGSVGAQRFCGTPATGCPARDTVYQSAPQGVVFPRYSQFWKSDDLGQTFRKSRQFPIYGNEQINAGGGGGDSHQDVGQLTHDVYFVDLTLFPGITVNVSEDLGETWRSDPFGQGLAFLDDRQWVAADEAVDRVYLSTINLLNLVTPTLAVYRNTTGAPAGGWNASPCNPGTFAIGSSPVDPPASDAVATPCADPADPYLWVAGPVVADDEGTTVRPPSHNVYVPFVRRIVTGGLGDVFPIQGWQLYVAKSTDAGSTWTRQKVADLPADVNPSNIFVQMTIDRGGNLYYTWSQTQGASTTSSQGKRTDPGSPREKAGEQDIYYTYSTGGGLTGTWATPINLTKESGDSAVFPWMVAGDPGQVDLVYYKSNSGLNSNVALVDESGQPCDDDAAPGCDPNPAVWNTYFAQSQNALNTGANFKSVQVTAQPNHIGVLCTGGLGCDEDRDLLDFITVDVDRLGAAHIAYSDDNRRRASDTQDFMTRQIAGNGVFKNQTITLRSAWPIRDHAVSDRAGDVFDPASVPKGSCPGMDLLGMTMDRSGDLLRATLTLNGAPTATGATACGGVASSGGVWGVEFWSAAGPPGGPEANRFYIAYRDDAVGGARVEGGAVDNVNTALTSLEFNRIVGGTLGGTCFPVGGTPATGTCTITMTVPASGLGITPGNALNNVTGLSLYFFGDPDRPPGGLVRLILGNSEQADATASFHVLGSGTP